jgi:mono/diheme cytochrome c family protein
MKAALIGVVAVLLSAEVAAAQAQDDSRMPEGPNRELTIKTCIGCHALSNLYSTVGRTREGWSRVLDDMKNYGMNVTAQERAQILDYLSTALGR